MSETRFPVTPLADPERFTRKFESSARTKRTEPARLDKIRPAEKSDNARLGADRIVDPIEKKSLPAKSTNFWGDIPIADSFPEFVSSLKSRSPNPVVKPSESSEPKPLNFAVPDEWAKPVAKTAEGPGENPAGELAGDPVRDPAASPAGETKQFNEQTSSTQASVIVDVDIAKYTAPVKRKTPKPKPVSNYAVSGSTFTNLDSDSTVDIDLHSMDEAGARAYSSDANELDSSLDLSGGSLDIVLAEMWQETFGDEPSKDQEIAGVITDTPKEETTSKSPLASPFSSIANSQADDNEQSLFDKAKAEMETTARRRLIGAKNKPNNAQTVSEDSTRNPTMSADKIQAKKSRAQIKRAEATRNELVRAEAVRIEAAKIKAARLDVSRAEVSDAGKDAISAEANRVATARTEAERVAKLAQQELVRSEQAHAERIEAVRMDSIKRVEEAKRAETFRQAIIAKRAGEAKRAARNELLRAEAVRTDAAKAKAARLDANRARVAVARKDAISAEANRVATARTEAERVAKLAQQELARSQQANAERIEAVRIDSIKRVEEAKRAETLRQAIVAKRAEEAKRAAGNEVIRVEAVRNDAAKAKEARIDANRARVAVARKDAIYAEANRVAAARTEAERVAKLAQQELARSEQANAERIEAERLENIKRAEEVKHAEEAKRAEAVKQAELAMQAEVSSSEYTVTDIDLVRQSAKSAARAEIAQHNKLQVVEKIEAEDEFFLSPAEPEFSAPLSAAQSSEVDVVWLDDTSNITVVDIVLPPSTGQSLSNDDTWNDEVSAYDETSNDPLVLDQTNYMDQSMEFMAGIQEEDFDDTAGFNVPAASYTSTKTPRGWVARALSAMKKLVSGGVSKSIRWIKSKR